MSKQQPYGEPRNPAGYAQTVTRPEALKENLRNLKHGVRSENGRALAPRAAEIADALMTLPFAVPLDLLAAQEIGSLIATLEAID